MTRAFIMGFIGSGNLGDEAILAGTLLRWRQTGTPDPLVFSWRPEETAQLHKVVALPVEAGWRGLVNYARLLQRGDLLILGGGSLLQDGEPRIVPFWLARAVAARLRGCRVVYHAQGVGPLKTCLGKLLVSFILPLTAHLVTVRDKDSFKLVANAHPTLVADPALLLSPVERRTVPGRVVVALRPSIDGEEREMQLLQVLCTFKDKYKLEYIFVAMHDPDDCQLAARLALATGGTQHKRLTVDELREVLASAELVLAMRLHAAILSAGVHTPAVGLSYDPKVKAFFASIGMEEAVVPWGPQFSPQVLAETLNTIYAKRAKYVEKLQQDIPLEQAKATQAVDLALSWRGRKP